MTWRLIFLAVVACYLTAAEHHGVVKFGTVPIPGAAVTAQQGNKKQTVLTDGQGLYSFPDLSDGTWTLDVEMRGFTPLKRDLQVPETPPVPVEWSLKMLPLTEISTAPAAEVRVAEAPKVDIKRPANVAAPAANNTTSGFQRTQVAASNTAPPAPAAEVTAEMSQRAADGFLVNGSVNNAASSPFSQLPAFGNNRGVRRWPYNGNIAFIADNSAFDARNYSLTGQNTLRPSYNNITGSASLGGPLRIPGLLKNGPNFTINYQWTRNRNVTTKSAIVPTEAERNGDFSNSRTLQGNPVILPGFGTQIPVTSISPQARALLQFYPLPNYSSGRYNYQVPLVNGTHQDSLQYFTNKQVGRKDNLSGTLQMTSARTDNPNIFGFLATGRSLNTGTQITWRHSFSSRMYTTIAYQFNRNSSQNIPYWSNRQNISGNFGITGNNQDPTNWGPPTLSFSNGIEGLGEAQYSRNVNQFNGVSITNNLTRRSHNVTYGFDFRRTQTNTISQDNPRGAFQFNGVAAGYDFAGFLLGVPDASSIAYGNADKYFRSNSWDTYIADDWRVRSGLTLNLGVRWDYNSPISEIYGRLVNMSVGPNFTTATPIVANQTSAPLIRPDKNNFSPRVAFSWRPLPASSLIVRGDYGIYYDTSVYQTIASQMAQQAPLSTSLRVQNSLANPLTLANGFIGSPNITATTFGIDPNFRVGYAQNWKVSVQRDLPYAMQVVATYLGVKGTRAVQQFLPNTFPPLSLDPCTTCPSGFSYMTSNGNSSRQAGILQLRRRLRNGFTAELQYTYSKSIDNAALGGSGLALAQNWLDLKAERARSNFDQRHAITLTTQYTTGATSGLGFLSSGKKGVFFREWTIATSLTMGTGLPLTPNYLTVVPGTGSTGSIRGNYTGADIYAAPPGLNLNPAAFSIPAPGTWGNAGRNIITGPSQFAFNASLGRTFRMGDRFNGDLRVDATNFLNHPVFPNWNTIITNTQFGLPNTTNPMRKIQTSFRLRF